MDVKQVLKKQVDVGYEEVSSAKRPLQSRCKWAKVEKQSKI